MSSRAATFFSWFGNSKGRIAFALLVWLAAHAILVAGVCTGRFEFFSAQREPIIYWIDVILSGLVLLAGDFAAVCHFLRSKS
jgi:hypothetical protein